ncbi:thioredoxin-dependent thiol peroxidase [bacterium]|nr:thioredoxin-dependent thiol peroxidase [bacterium]
MLEEGDKALAFCLPDQDDNKTCLIDFQGKWLVLYFYPKDNTSGCTREAQEFSANKKDFEKLNAVILGVSPDSAQSHSSFIKKKNLEITLLSDPEHTVLDKYGVWQLKKMYRREYHGVVRSTFLIDPEGKLRAVWRKVKVNGHAEEVKSVLKALSE